MVIHYTFTSVLHCATKPIKGASKRKFVFIKATDPDIKRSLILCCVQAQFPTHQLVQTSRQRVQAGDGEGGSDRPDAFWQVHSEGEGFTQAAGPPVR